jgi:hypothetical protein
MILAMFGTAQPSLLAFPEERPVFLREYSTNHYSVIAYFTCRLFMEALVTFIQIMIQVRITLVFSLSLDLCETLYYSCRGIADDM